MIRVEKEKKIADLKKTLEISKSIVLVDFKGIDVEMTNSFRNEVKKQDVKYLVIKNTLLKKAIESTKYEGMSKYLTGPTAVAYSEADPVTPAKTVRNFSKKNKIFNIKGGFLDDVLDQQEVIDLADLPSKEELLGKALYVFSSPLVNFMNVLNNTIRNLIVLLKNLETQKATENTNNGG